MTGAPELDGRNGVDLAPLLVGLGSSDRGDDAVGPQVASAIASLCLPGVLVVEHEDPTGLLDLWAGHDPVVVVDAVCSGHPPGTLHHLETGDGLPPLPRAAWSGTGRGGTHAFGLAAAVELARAMHRLPDRLVIIGVEASGFDYHAPLSAPVAEALEYAIARVLAALAGVAVPDPAHDEEGVRTHVPGRAC